MFFIRRQSILISHLFHQLSDHFYWVLVRIPIRGFCFLRDNFQAAPNVVTCPRSGQNLVPATDMELLVSAKATAVPQRWLNQGEKKPHKRVTSGELETSHAEQPQVLWSFFRIVLVPLAIPGKPCSFPVLAKPHESWWLPRWLLSTHKDAKNGLQEWNLA